MFRWLFGGPRYVTRAELRRLVQAQTTFNTSLVRKLTHIMNDLTKLQDAVSKLEAAAGTVQDQQPAIDDLTTRVNAVTDKLAPPATPAP